MLLFPYHNAITLFDCPKDEVFELLKANINAKPFWAPALVEGMNKLSFIKISNDTWKVYLRRSYYNPGKPVIIMKISDTLNNQTQMKVEFKTHILVRIFCILFAFLNMLFLIYRISNAEKIEPIIFLTPTLMIIAPFLMNYAFFYMDLDHSLNYLNRITRKLKVAK